MEIFEKVKTVLHELCGAEELCPESELQGGLGLDSLQMVALLMMLEETFSITLEESDMNPFDLTDVAHVVGLVEKYVGGDKDDDKKEN